MSEYIPACSIPENSLKICWINCLLIQKNLQKNISFLVYLCEINKHKSIIFYFQFSIKNVCNQIDYSDYKTQCLIRIKRFANSYLVLNFSIF